jgi:hypothetical protein
MSVENFIQDSIFDDIFPPVAGTVNFQQLSSRSPARSLLRSTERKRPSADGSLPEFESFDRLAASVGSAPFEVMALSRSISRPNLASGGARTRPEMIALVLARESKLRRSDGDLQEAALRLLAKYLSEFHERPSAISWPGACRALG